MTSQITTAPARTDLEDWLGHWSESKQESLVQRFFSFYRKAVFSRTVAYFTNKYFPARGLFVEAGSGTSETSIRMDRRQGARRLVAVDIVVPVLQKTPPVMDFRLGGDIFALPFRSSSLDGVWNVGVMEHFTQAQIDAILCEFHRVLKPGAPLILLWPGTRSIPQRMLRLAEKAINSRRPTGSGHYRFHPPEISQLPSVAAGRQVLERNGFELVEADSGPKSLMAFITLAGRKPHHSGGTVVLESEQAR